LISVDALPSRLRELGFEPWEGFGVRGAFRQVTFVKDALLGEVCRYHALDHLIWGTVDVSLADRILAGSSPLEDVMTQRFLIWIRSGGDGRRRVRSFLFGFRGFAEVCVMGPGMRPPRGFEDLVVLAEAFLEGPKGGGDGRV
jgi:hypothetical protein